MSLPYPKWPGVREPITAGFMYTAQEMQAYRNQAPEPLASEMTAARPDLEALTREEFEVHMRKLNACVCLYRQNDSVGGEYRTVSVERSWKLWQAADKAATERERERAAKVCENYGELAAAAWRAGCKQSPHREGQADGAFDCATAIRKTKESEC